MLGDIAEPEKITEEDRHSDDEQNGEGAAASGTLVEFNNNSNADQMIEAQKEVQDIFFLKNEASSPKNKEVVPGK